MINLDSIDQALDIGISKVSSMGGNGNSRIDVIDLCKTKSDKAGKYPATLGTVSFVPIIDRDANIIHKVSGVKQLTVPVANESYNPGDPTSKPFFWTKFNMVPESNYKNALMQSDKAKLNELDEIMQEYNEEYGLYGLQAKNLFFIKSFIIRLKTTAGGLLYQDVTTPVVLQHSSARFPDTFNQCIKSNDEIYGKEWRRNLFLPDGEIKHILTCSTNKKEGVIGYDVNCAYFANITTGKSLSREKLKEYMDYDIHEIGINTTVFNANVVQYAIDCIDAAFDIQKEMRASAIDGQSVMEARPAQVLPNPSMNMVPQQPVMGQPVSEQPAQPVINAQTTPVQPQPVQAVVPQQPVMPNMNNVPNSAPTAVPPVQQGFGVPDGAGVTF